MYYVVNKETNKVYAKTWYAKKAYEMERTAKAQATRLNKGLAAPLYVVMTAEQVRAIPVKMVERVNLMSGEKYMEAEDTPNFCSPASEAYWSM